MVFVFSRCLRCFVFDIRSLRHLRTGAESPGSPRPAPPPGPAPPAKPRPRSPPRRATGKSHTHGGKRPQPDIVTPNGPVTTPPPPDAAVPLGPAADRGHGQLHQGGGAVTAPPGGVVLLGPGADLGKWQMQQGGGAVTWEMKAGVLQTGKGMIQTKQAD